MLHLLNSPPLIITYTVCEYWWHLTPAYRMGYARTQSLLERHLSPPPSFGNFCQSCWSDWQRAEKSSCRSQQDLTPQSHSSSRFLQKVKSGETPASEFSCSILSYLEQRHTVCHVNLVNSRAHRSMAHRSNQRVSLLRNQRNRCISQVNHTLLNSEYKASWSLSLFE